MMHNWLAATIVPVDHETAATLMRGEAAQAAADGVEVVEVYCRDCRERFTDASPTCMGP